MGNNCCEGRPGKSNTVTSSDLIQRKSTLLSSKLRRGRTKSLKRTSSGIGRSLQSLSRTRTSPHTSMSQLLRSYQAPPNAIPVNEVPVSPGSDLNGSEPVSAGLQSTALRLNEEETGPENLNLDYMLESGRDCSHNQQKQILALFETDEEMDGLSSVSVLNGKEKFEVLVLVVSSKCLYLLSAFDYSEIKTKIYLSGLRLLCLNTDRTAVALVYKRGVDSPLEHIILSSTKYEDLIKAIVTVHFEDSGKLLPAVTMPTMAEIVGYINRLTWAILTDLTSSEMAKIAKIFATKGMIGENKLLNIQCLKEIDGTDRAVILIVSDRALYTVSYSYILIDRIPLETVTAVKYQGTSHVSILTDVEHRYNIASRQGQILEEAITAFKHRSNTL